MKHSDQAHHHFIEVSDLEGARHIIRVSDIERVADADIMRNESVIVVSGQPLMVRTPLDAIRAVMFPQAADKKTVH